MLRRKWMALAGLLLFALIPAFAGEPGKKCTMNTQECLNKMAAKLKNTGWIGVEVDQEKIPGQMVITQVFPGTPAESAGIQPGDVLYAVNGLKFGDKSSEEGLMALKKDWIPGKSVTYTLKRGGQDKQVSLKLAPMPADVIARYIGEHMLEHAATEVAAK